MGKLLSAWLDLRTIDELSRRQTLIHQVHPAAKALVTAAFILTVTSFGKYEIAGLFPLFFYPVMLISLAELPSKALLKRLLLVSPFALFIGLFNPIFDQTPQWAFGSLLLTGGWLSFISILLKFTLTTLAALLLIATTTLPDLGAALRRLGVPRPLVVQLLFLYRYLSVLLTEAGRMAQACELRAAPGSGLPYRTWGSLLGQLLLRTIDRAERIYAAMRCRGFDGEIKLLQRQSFQKKDAGYLLLWLVFFLSCRLINLPHALGKLLLEVL